MDLLEEHRVLVVMKISAMTHGTTAGLVEIFGLEWDAIGSSGQKKNFGRLFKRAVKNNEFPEIQWKGIANAGRYDLYQKI